MLPRSKRKRHHREPIERRWPVVIYDDFDAMEKSLAELNRRMEELRAWAVEQLRLKNLDDGLPQPPA
jgi:hypothetical protein